MQSMRERAELSGGNYALSSALGHGTKVCVGWPALKAADVHRDQARCALCGMPPSVSSDAPELRACSCANALDAMQKH